MLEKAIRIAVQAHDGQRDKAGNPYILHPLQLRLQMDTPEEMMVAVLHDVVGDSSNRQAGSTGDEIAYFSAIIRR